MVNPTHYDPHTSNNPRSTWQHPRRFGRPNNNYRNPKSGRGRKYDAQHVTQRQHMYNTPQDRAGPTFNRNGHMFEQRPPLRCYYCNMDGHKIADCYWNQ